MRDLLAGGLLILVVFVLWQLQGARDEDWQAACEARGGRVEWDRGVGYYDAGLVCVETGT